MDYKTIILNSFRTSCGSVIEFKKDFDYCPLKDYNEQRSHGGYYVNNSYYPGQTLFGSIGALDNAKWLNTSSEMQSMKKNKLVNKKV